MATTCWATGRAPGETRQKPFHGAHSRPWQPKHTQGGEQELFWFCSRVPVVYHTPTISLRVTIIEKSMRIVTNQGWVSTKKRWGVVLNHARKAGVTAQWIFGLSSLDFCFSGPSMWSQGRAQLYKDSRSLTTRPLFSARLSTLTRTRQNSRSGQQPNLFPPGRRALFTDCTLTW